MATDATGTPTSLGIPTYNTSVDAPSGLGFNAAMASIDALFLSRTNPGFPASPTDGDVPVYNSGSGLWVRSLTKPITVGQLASVPRVRVRRTTTQSIPNNVDTVVTFDTEDFDTDSMHSTVSNTGRITITTAGTYVIAANLNFTANGTGSRSLYLQKNGTFAQPLGYSRLMTASGTVSAMLGVTAIVALSAADYVEVLVNQDSGGALNVLNSATNFDPWFAAARVSA